MNLEYGLSQIMLWTIALLAALIAYEFYNSNRGGNGLRWLMIELFVTKVWVYGGAAIYYLINPTVPFVWIRLILNLPMFYVMIKLWKYIRIKK